MRKKFLVLFLVFSLVFSGVSKAFIFLGAPAFAYMSAGEVAGALTGLGLGALIGQQLGWIEIPSLNPSEPDVRIPLTPLPRDRPVANPDAPSITPVVNPATVQSSQSCPPTSTANAVTSTYCKGVVVTTYTANANGSCDAHLQASPVDISGCPSGYQWSSDTPNAASLITTCPTGYTASNGTCNKNPETPSCGAGYTIQDGQCSLTNPQAIPDGKADIEVIDLGNGGVAYRFNPDDPDQNPALTIAQGAALWTMMHPNAGKDAATDSPVQVSIDPSGGTGMCPYQTCVPVPGLPGHFRISALSNTSRGGQAVVIDVNKNTGIVDQASVVPLSGYVIGQGQTYVDTNGVTQTVQAGQIAIAQPINGTYVQSANPAVPTVQIDTSNLAKTGESAAAAGTVVNSLNTNLQAQDIDIASPTAALNASFNAINDNLTPKNENQPDIDFSWVPSLKPGTFTACTPFTFSMNPTMGAASGLTGSGEIDICDKLDLARQILGWLLGVVTVFYIFRVFVSANKAAL